MKQYREKNSKNRRFGIGPIREDLIALVYWILEGEGKKDAMYPFSLPHLEFFQRCQGAMKRADVWAPLPRSKAERQVLLHIKGLIRKLEKDDRFQNAVGHLEKG